LTLLQDQLTSCSEHLRFGKKSSENGAYVFSVVAAGVSPAVERAILPCGRGAEARTGWTVRNNVPGGLEAGLYVRQDA
jgi:hypothetical protein